MTRNLYRAVVAAGLALGGLATLMFSMANFLFGQGIFEKYIRNQTHAQQAYVTAQSTSTIYGVLLLLLLLGIIAIAVLLFSILKGKEEKYGLLFAIFPIWGIEALSLLAIDYSALANNAFAIVTFILTLLIIVAGSIGVSLMMKGKRIAGRILTTIFMAVVFAGTILNLTSQNDFSYVQGMTVTGNVLRFLALIPVCVVLFASVRDVALPSTPLVAEPAKPAPTEIKDEKSAAQKVEPAASKPATPTPVAPKPAASTTIKPRPAGAKPSLRDKLLEIQKLYDEGAISQQEYDELMKQIRLGKY